MLQSFQNKILKVKLLVISHLSHTGSAQPQTSAAPNCSSSELQPDDETGRGLPASRGHRTKVQPVVQLLSDQFTLKKIRMSSQHRVSGWSKKHVFSGLTGSYTFYTVSSGATTRLGGTVSSVEGRQQSHQQLKTNDTVPESNINTGSSVWLKAPPPFRHFHQ